MRADAWEADALPLSYTRLVNLSRVSISRCVVLVVLVDSDKRSVNRTEQHVLDPQNMYAVHVPQNEEPVIWTVTLHGLSHPIG